MAPTDQELDDLVNIVYSKLDAGEEYVETKLTVEWFAKLVIYEVDPTSSPGLPWKKQYKDCSFLLDDRGLTEEAYAVFEDVAFRLGDLAHGPKADNINLFIKDEPHSIKKVNNGAWRLISGVGFTDRVIDRLLFGDWIRRHLWRGYNLDTPVAAGYVPYAGGFRKMAAKFRGLEPETADKSSWDWTVQPWMIEFICKYFVKTLKPSAVFEQVIRNRLTALFRTSILEYDGHQFCQNDWGVMKSGFYGTISFNGLLQFALHTLAQMRTGGVRSGEFYAVGDDTIQERETPEYWEALACLGCIVKERHVGWPAEFVGVLFDDRAGVPMYPSKNLYNLLHMHDDVARDSLLQYQALYSFSDLFKPLNELATHYDAALSRDQAREWVLGYRA